MSEKKSTNQNQSTESFAPTKLYRSETNKVIAGVAGGLAEFFNVDPTLVRLIFLLIALFGGGGVLLYLILWLIIPVKSNLMDIPEDSIKKNADEIKDKAQKFAEDMRLSGRSHNSRALFGMIILGLGIIFLLGNFGLWRIFDLGKFWPLLLVAVGLMVLVRNDRK